MEPTSLGERKKARKADEDFEAEEVKGEETAVAAFNAALIVPPSSPPPINTNVPKANYVPQYVYGYRGYDSRQNLFFTSESKLVYPMAALGIIMDPAKNVQSFFGGKALGKTTNQHDDDILCLAVSSDRKKVATGQTGTKPKIFVWNAGTGAYIAKYVLSDTKSKGIVSCAFSNDGEYIAFSDLGNDHVLYVISASNGKLLWSKPTGKSVVYGIAWSSGKDFATCGANYVKFWNVDTQAASDGTGLDSEIMSCVAFDSKGHCYVSSVNGKIFILEGHKVSKKIQAHKGKINSIVINDEFLISAGDDKKAVVMDVSSHEVVYSLNCKNIPRAADVMGNQAVTGDAFGGITLYKDGKEVDSWLGHHEGEIRGLDVADNLFITAGDDNKVIVWDSHKCKAIHAACVNEKPGQKLKDGAPTKSKFPDNQCSRAISYNSSTKEVAIATNSGEVHIRDLGEIEKDKKVIQCSKKWIECMCYSPKGQMLAVGTHANEVFIYDVPSYDLKGKLTGHSTPLICLDWTSDESYLRSLDEGFDMLFWEISSLTQDKDGPNTTKDADWHTQSCKIGWSVQGIYPPGVDKNHVNAAAKSRDGKLIVTGDDWGFVNFYNYPCGKGAKCTSLRGHSEQVAKVSFSNADEYIFSVGGEDKAVIQWKKQ